MAEDLFVSVLQEAWICFAALKYQTKEGDNEMAKEDLTGKKATKIAALAAAVVVVCLIVLALLFTPKPQSGDKQITVTLTDNNGADTVYEHSTDAEYLLEAVREIEGLELQGEEGEYGFFITAINGITADYSVDQSYWAIYVNGEYGSYGIELQPITDGDAFSLVYVRDAY